jgi:nicotinate-nucleotide adenylyltransferase
LEFYRRAPRSPSSIGILAGSFNPPTVAHLELARAAKAHVDEILWVVPRVFPHKEYFGATLRQRLEMLDSLGLPAPYSIAATDRGLFIDIARASRPHYGSETKLYFVCGRDAAERILNWDYGDPGVVEGMMREFELLVAARGGRLRPPGELQDQIHELVVQGEHDHVSSSEVRERIARGEAWEHLVPESIIERVREIYS